MIELERADAASEFSVIYIIYMFLLFVF